MSVQTEITRMASEDFTQAMAKGRRQRLVRRLTGMNSALRSFTAVRNHKQLSGRRDIGLQLVPVNHIIGSVEQRQDFDRAFYPRSEHLEKRWVSIDKSYYQDAALPPIVLVKVGEDYFVVDGHHRVSVARTRSQLFIDAYVSEVDLS